MNPVPGRPLDAEGEPPDDAAHAMPGHADPDYDEPGDNRLAASDDDD